MFKKIFLLISLIFLLGLIYQLFSSELAEIPAQAAGTDNVRGWAWSENIGWISFNCINQAACNGTNYGVNVNPQNGKFSGYGWSENIGWISFNRDDTGTPPGPPFNSDENFIAKVKSSGQIGKSDVDIQGWARALSYDGGWDGWIKFSKDEADSGADYSSYIGTDFEFRGWAWGSDVVGWISFNCENQGVCETQSNYKAILTAPTPILTFVAQPSSIFSGDTSTLYWTSEGVTNCTASSEPSDEDWDGPKDTDGSQEVSPIQDTAYTLICSGWKEDIERSVTVKIRPKIKWKEIGP